MKRGKREKGTDLGDVVVQLDGGRVQLGFRLGLGVLGGLGGGGVLGRVGVGVGGHFFCGGLKEVVRG